MDTLRLVLIIIGVLILGAIYLYSARRRDANKYDSEEITDNDVYKFDYPPVSITSPDVTKARQPEPENFSEQLSQLSGMISQDKIRPAPGVQAVTQQARQVARANSTNAAVSTTATYDAPQPADVPQPEWSAAKSQTSAAAESPHEASQQDDIKSVDGFPQAIVLNIIARHGLPFQGSDILNAVHTAGMEFGDMGIFHRFTLAGGRRRPIFSLANMLEPGSFDFEDMAAFSTAGLTLFMQLPAPVDSLIAYEDMLTTAQGIAGSLNGDVCDERRNVLTLQAIDHTHEQLREFNYKLIVARKRAEQQ